MDQKSGGKQTAGCDGVAALEYIWQRYLFEYFLNACKNANY